MGKGSSPVWGVHLVSGHKRRGWAGTGKEENVKRQRWGKKRTKGESWFLCFHSWDFQNNEPFFAEDEWAAVEIMSEVLLQINKSVSQIPIWREF